MWLFVPFEIPIFASLTYLPSAPKGLCFALCSVCFSLSLIHWEGFFRFLYLSLLVNELNGLHLGGGVSGPNRTEIKKKTIDLYIKKRGFAGFGAV